MMALRRTVIHVEEHGVAVQVRAGGNFGCE